jgi:hypothetical protein
MGGAVPRQGRGQVVHPEMRAQPRPAAVLSETKGLEVVGPQCRDKGGAMQVWLCQASAWVCHFLLFIGIQLIYCALDIFALCNTYTLLSSTGDILT